MNSDDIFMKVKEIMPDISTYGPFRLELCDAEEAENVIFDLCSQIMSRDEEMKRLDNRIKKALECVESSLKVQVEMEVQIEKMKCCGNCGNRKNRICNIKSEIPLGEDVCDNWARKNNPKNSTPQ